MKKILIQFTAFLDDAEYFKNKQKEYRFNDKYAGDLFKEMVEAYKEKNNESS